ncbi:hypothetical protein C0W96_07180 [Photobacterium kishitanii]|uniref:hypothetical protein n=1 Tax=Photobacterium kishitanii TaxID=318456 RepID=UPI0005D44C5E|nr:hypothetical protein [Photobacterium kishitanii]KJG11610.1 hypothetical protein UB40_03105 [Photobacterium kishitanii]PSV07038.1 hypothetical protein C0W96_07180 [Photobacterium kishitanii]PSV77941.1 hypothetical protein C0W29_01055 [Photobacterium kishitanii]
MKQTLTAIGISLMLYGCAATTETVKPKAFSDKYSYAYNVANQTALTANKSKLKDFTKKEIDELKKVDLVGGSAGSASMLFGTLSLLTGDFASAAVNLSGGIVADLSAKKHSSGYSRFIVTNTLSNDNESDEIASTIRKAILDTLPNGYKIERISFRGSIVDFIVGGKCDSVSALNLNFENDAFYSIKSEDINPELNWCLSGGYESFAQIPMFSNYQSNLYHTVTSNYGFDSGRAPYGTIDFNGILKAMNIDINVVNYNELIKEISSKLPKTYYFYKTNFSKTVNKNTNKIVTLMDVMPAIFNNGVMYNFIETE